MRKALAVTRIVVASAECFNSKIHALNADIVVVET